jgi:hypothetical protein
MRFSSNAGLPEPHDHGSEADGSSRIDGFTSSIEPGKVVTHAALSSGRRRVRGEGMEEAQVKDLSRQGVH